MSEQGRGSSYGNISWDINEAVHAALGAKFNWPKNSALGTEFLRRHRKNMGKSLESSRCTGDHL